MQLQLQRSFVRFQIKQVSLCGFWLMDSRKRGSPIQIVTVSHVHCLRPCFSSKAIIGVFLFGLVHGIGYIHSPCFERPAERRHEKRKVRRWSAERSMHVVAAGVPSVGRAALSPSFNCPEASCLRTCYTLPSSCRICCALRWGRALKK